MTLELSNSPGKPEIKTWWDNMVHIRGETSEIEISMEDFMAAAYYVLTNSALVSNDPRLVFIKIAKGMHLLISGKGFSYEGRECFSLAYPGDYKRKEG